MNKGADILAAPKSSATATRVFRRRPGAAGPTPTTTTGRHFYSRTETLAFYDRGTVQPLMPDLILSTTLKEEDNNDLTFEETWATSDYWFKANNFALTQR